MNERVGLFTDVECFIGETVKTLSTNDLSPSPTERGRMIQRARVLQGYTQSELARRAGVTVTTLYRSERGFSVRESSLRKIATGLDMKLDVLLKSKPIMSLGSGSHIVHRAPENFWFAPIDRRRNVPHDNEGLVQSSDERRRLGRLGLTPIFACYPSLIMPDGPGATLIEVYGRYPHAFNPSIYRDCMMHVLRGDVRLQILDDVVELSEGDFVGFISRDLRWIEPAAPFDLHEPTPLVLWFGAVRLGHVHVESLKRAIVRKPRKSA